MKYMKDRKKETARASKWEEERKKRKRLTHIITVKLFCDALSLYFTCGGPVLKISIRHVHLFLPMLKNTRSVKKVF